MIRKDVELIERVLRTHKPLDHNPNGAYGTEFANGVATGESQQFSRLVRAFSDALHEDSQEFNKARFVHTVGHSA